MLLKTAIKRRDVFAPILMGWYFHKVLVWSSDIALSGLTTPPPAPRRMIEFEALGGVGDGDPETGKGTDNAKAFALAEKMAQQGYGVKFKPGSSYKTTEQINIHNMYWVGNKDHSPVIFGWFIEKGKKIIGRSKSNSPSSACIIGLTFHRCGEFAEHGIVIDHLDSFYFDGSVTSRPGAQGGAIGISPFFPETRHSRNCFIRAKLNNSGDFGVQFGSVSNAVLDIEAIDCYREVIGIEPIVDKLIEINALGVKNNSFPVNSSGLFTGLPLLYCYGDNSRGILVPSNHYFIIKNKDGSVSLAKNRADSFEGRRLDLSILNGMHYFARSAIVENVLIRSAKIVDNNSIKPTLYANTRGYVIFTGNSGGYMENVKVDNISIEGNKLYPKGKSVGVYVQGVDGLTLKNIKVHGCDDAIVVTDGWLNGMFDEKGRPIHTEIGHTKLLSKNIFITDPDLTDFRSYGVVFQGDGGVLIGGRFSSSVRGAKILFKE